MRSIRRVATRARWALRLSLVFAALPVRGQDVLTIPDVFASSSSGIVRVPVYARDVLGTPIGRDQPPGRRISDVSVSVVYGPNPCLDAVWPFFDTSTGILAGVDGVFESTPRIAHETQAYLFASAGWEGLPFSSEVAPGDKLGDFIFSLDGCGPQAIPLALDAQTSGLFPVIESGDRPYIRFESGWLVTPGGTLPPSTPGPTETPVNRVQATSTPVAVDAGAQPSAPAAAVPVLDGRGLSALAAVLAAAALLFLRRAR